MSLKKVERKSIKDRSREIRRIGENGDSVERKGERGMGEGDGWQLETRADAGLRQLRF